MVITELNGGLGNQMFQYAAGKALSIHHGVKLALDLSWFHKKLKSGTQRKFHLKYLSVSEPLTSNVDFEKLKDFHPAFKTGQFYRLVEKLKPYYKRSVYKEPHCHFDTRFFLAPKNVHLSGYWQSEKYFINVKDELRKKFKVKKPLKGENRKVAHDIRSTNSVGVHIRRGDYVHDKRTRKVHGVVPMEHYIKGIKKIKYEITKPTFFLFSDEPLWVQNNFHIDSPIQIVCHNGEEKDYEDLRLMSLCKHQIIANSSFSWWAGWLNDYTEKMVIAPRRWYKNRKNDIKDLYPDSWILI